MLSDMLQDSHQMLSKCMVSTLFLSTMSMLTIIQEDLALAVEALEQLLTDLRQDVARFYKEHLELMTPAPTDHMEVESGSDDSEYSLATSGPKGDTVSRIDAVEEGDNSK